jgi:hypothetical protein
VFDQLRQQVVLGVVGYQIALLVQPPRELLVVKVEQRAETLMELLERQISVMAVKAVMDLTLGV